MEKWQQNTIISHPEGSKAYKVFLMLADTYSLKCYFRISNDRMIRSASWFDSHEGFASSGFCFRSVRHQICLANHGNFPSYPANHLGILRFDFFFLFRIYKNHQDVGVFYNVIFHDINHIPVVAGWGTAGTSVASEGANFRVTKSWSFATVERKKTQSLQRDTADF